MIVTRKRSHWAWGWQDQLPNETRRKELGEQLSMFLGLDPLTLGPIPDISQCRVRASNIEVPQCLTDIVVNDAESRITKSMGRGFKDIVRGYQGDFSCAPDCVAKITTERDVERILDWCNHNNYSCVPVGGGTSVVGGIETYENQRKNGVVALDLEGLNKVLEIDPISKAARIQAGALGPVLENQLGEQGFTLRHFPQSFEFSTLGGWIATRAGGHFATLYTHIDDLVESVRMVSPKGAFETRRLPASGAGPDPNRMIIGSEGAFGVITEAWMRIQKRPTWRASASVFFESFAQGALAARAISQSGLFPSNCRLLDATEALLNGVPSNGNAVLILGFESAEYEREAWIDQAINIAVSHGGACPKGKRVRKEESRENASAEATWRQAFIEAPYLQSSLLTLGVMADTFETACTWDRFPILHETVTRTVLETIKRECGKGVITCRFTHIYPDGPAPYFTFLAPIQAGQELEKWAIIKKAASEALLACGATITHHHAVGRTHHPWYTQERPNLFGEAIKACKQVFDPGSIMNPGVLV